MESLKTSQGFWQDVRDSKYHFLGVKLILIATSIVWLALIAVAWNEAQAAEDDDEPVVTTRSSKNDEYNFNWLDPDKKIYVLQNRKYLKTGHPILSVLGGGSMSNPYRNVYSVDGRFAYYISEWLGFEVGYSNYFNSQNTTFNALKDLNVAALPTVREFRSGLGGMVHFVPWYAKINVFNSILYFDWYFALGLSSLSTVQDTRTSFSASPNYVSQNLLGYTISTGHNFFLSESFIFRWDMTAIIYSATYQTGSNDTALFSQVNFTAGLGWRL